MDRNSKILIGLAGEYFVAGMMNMKGWVASLTLKNYPSVDIFGFNPATNKTVNIQVKTTRGKLNYQVGLKRSQRAIIRDKIKATYIFVHISSDDKIRRYFILSQDEIISLIESTDDLYFNRPRIKQLADYPIGIQLSDLEPFENKWDNLWK